VNNQEALDKIEQKFGSVEDFAWVLLNEYPEVVDGKYNLQNLSQRLKIPMEAVNRTLNSQHFRGLMTRLVVQSEYAIADEIKHVRTMKRDATNARKNVNTRIAAREHLARLEGRPLNRQDQEITVPIQINFGSLTAHVEGMPTIDVEGQGFRMAKPGELPPEGARRRYTDKSTGKALVNGIARGDELDFYSDESPYALESVKTVSGDKAGDE
jgi:hypothetical protein